ncbi:glycosyl transferase group 2 family [Clostridium sp. CAG:921]|nr:glycosyl transferase group 2 family [Clostridium sp. CAG:921]
MNFRNLRRGYNYLKANGVKKSLLKLKNKIKRRKYMSNQSVDYLDYVKNNKLSIRTIEKQRSAKFNYMPKISIVVPMYNTKFSYFVELIDSINNQTYQNFEVCLADSSKIPDVQIQKYIQELNSNKIVYKNISQNLGISENTNVAISFSTGDYVAFCDHDDVISINALYEVVKAINSSDADFIYTDEDILENGIRKNPHFKPDFSPDLLTSYNYICHLCVVKRKLLDEVGLLNKEFDGAQDYDFVLRATEKAKNIVHIPKVLYHWRAHETSTSYSSSAKEYVYMAGKRAIEEHFKRINIKAKVEILDEPGRYRVKYDVIGNPKISIIIPNKDSKSDLKKCIDSILKSSYQNYEIVIVENNSKTKEIFDYYDKIQKDNDNIKVVSIKIDKFNYSLINNFGVKNSKGEYIVLLNNDTKVLSNNWMEEMLGICQRDDVGIVGAKLLYPDFKVQHAGVVVGIGGVAGHVNVNIAENEEGYFSRANVINNFSAVTAACLMIKRSIFEKIDGLDEKLQVAFNDIDLCMKVRKLKYLIVFTPYAKLMHYESKTRGSEDTPEKIKRFESEMDVFKSKWKDELDRGDPYYNINLRLDKVNFEINTNKMEDKDE